MKKVTTSSLHIEWTPGWIQAIDIATGETAAGTGLMDLGALLNRHRQAVVGVGRNLVFLKALRLPKAAPEDLRRILSIQIAQFFPLPPSQLAFDFIQTADQTTEGFLTIIAAMRSEDLKQLHRDLEQVGLTAIRILPISLGAVAVASHAGFADALVVEGAPSGLAIDVVQNGSLRFTRIAPKDSDPLCEVQRTMAAAGSGGLPLIATGGVSLPEALPGSGSALKWLHEAPPFHFELAEERERAAKKRIASKTRLAALMVTSALLLDVLVWTDRSDMQAVVQKGEASWSRQLTKLRTTRKDVLAKADQMTAMQTTLKSAFQVAQPLSDVLSVVGDRLMPGTWLTGVTIERGKPLQIRGTAKNADDVSRYVKALGATGRFRDVRLVFANSAKIDKTPIVQFNATAVGIGNLPLPTPAKRTGHAAKKTTQTAEPSGTGAEQ